MRHTKTRTSPPPQRPAYPFAAIVGQEEMKLALLLNLIAPAVGGVLIMGERGTGKSTAVRALADLLRPIHAIEGCTYNCEPESLETLCDDCRTRISDGERLARRKMKVPVVELPLGATEDRVCGTLDVGRALREGERAFEPGLLARANRGFLYIDEVNLLEDHLVDLLLDVAASGVNRVEREGVSLEHPARFVLVGSGNPEEGELRPQLLDRFGLCAEIKTPSGIDERVEIVERCERFERDPFGFIEEFSSEQELLRKKIARAQKKFTQVQTTRECIVKAARLCQTLGVDGHRGEITLTRAARALAAFEGRARATDEDVARVAHLALRHRLRRDPLEQSSGGGRIQHALEEVFGDPAQTNTQAEGQHAGHQRETTNIVKKDAEAKSSDNASQEKESTQHPNGDAGGGEIQPAPLKDVSLPSDVFENGVKTGAARHVAQFRSRGVGSVNKQAEQKRGRFIGKTSERKTGAPVALEATLRASVVGKTSRAVFDADKGTRVSASDIRYKRLQSKAGRLYIFALDTSGSMALNRIGQAKGVLGHLLRKSYVSRDRIALVCFREDDGVLLLKPTSSVARAKRILDGLPVGGATPLPAGLLRTLEVVKSARAQGIAQIDVVFFTDGRGNVPLQKNGLMSRAASRAQARAEVEAIGAQFQRARVSTFVFDTGNRFTRDGAGDHLAAALGGRYIHMPNVLDAKLITESFNGGTDRFARGESIQPL